VDFSLSIPEVSSVLALIESESVKGGMGFGVGDSELFFPGELGGGPSMSFWLFPLTHPSTALLGLHCFLYFELVRWWKGRIGRYFHDFPHFLRDRLP